MDKISIYRIGSPSGRERDNKEELIGRERGRSERYVLSRDLMDNPELTATVVCSGVNCDIGPYVTIEFNRPYLSLSNLQLDETEVFKDEPDHIRQVSEGIFEEVNKNSRTLVFTLGTEHKLKVGGPGMVSNELRLVINSRV